MKKFISLSMTVIAVISLFAALFAQASAADAKTVRWAQWDYEKEKIVYSEMPVLGELKEGKNTVEINKGVYSFTAPESGYYLFSEVPSLIAASTKVNGNAVSEAASVVWNGGAMIVLCDNDNCYHVAYFDKGITYLDFYDCETDAVSSGSVTFEYAGEITSAAVDNETVYMGDEYEPWDNPEEPDCFVGLYIPATLTFSTGKTFTTPQCYSVVKKIKSGRQIFNAELYDGHGFDLEINLIIPKELIDRIEYPEGFVPSADAYFSFWNYFDGDPYYNYPEYIKVYLKDGSVKTAYKNREDYSSAWYGVEINEGRQYDIRLRYTMEDGRIVFMAMLDSIMMYSEMDTLDETEVRNYKTNQVEDIRHLKSITSDLLNQAKINAPYCTAAETMRFIILTLSEEFRLFIDYGRAVLHSNLMPDTSAVKTGFADIGNTISKIFSK